MDNTQSKSSVFLDLLGRMAKNKWLAIVQAALIVLCTYVLWYSAAYFAPYVLVAMAALVCLFFNLKHERQLSRFENTMTCVFSLLFALMITLANYNLWNSGALGVLKFVLLFFGTFVSFANILSFIARREFVTDNAPSKVGYKKVFLFTFLLIVIVNSAILFLCKYPGFLTMDSVLQVKQTMDGVYTNSHPFYHTMLLKLFLSIGLALFGNMNAAVATYMVFQICFMALSFAFAVVTMKEIGAPKWSVIALVAFFALMPYHMAYSITLWKDVIFGGIVLLYTVFLYRILKEVGNAKWNLLGLVLSGLGFCLFRSNGFFAFVGVTLLFVLLFKWQYKKLILVMMGIIVVSFVMKRPVLKMLDVAQPDFAESLSIPIQQVARDVVENNDFTEEQCRLLDQLADVERIPETYLWYISDPMKDLMRERNYQQAFSEHKADYIKLYVSRLVKHPWTYVKAWVDQTKGYWNSGYPYWIWCLYADGQDIGIHSTVRSGVMNKMVNSYLSHFSKYQALKPFFSIGFFVWCILLCLYVSMIKKDKVLALMTIPSLMIIVSLLVATPVFSEFRYAYGIFCTMPVLWVMATVDNGKSGRNKEMYQKQKKH